MNDILIIATSKFGLMYTYFCDNKYTTSTNTVLPHAKSSKENSFWHDSYSSLEDAIAGLEATFGSNVVVAAPEEEALAFLENHPELFL